VSSSPSSRSPFVLACFLFAIFPFIHPSVCSSSVRLPLPLFARLNLQRIPRCLLWCVRRNCYFTPPLHLASSPLLPLFLPPVNFQYCSYCCRPPPPLLSNRPTGISLRRLCPFRLFVISQTRLASHLVSNGGKGRRRHTDRQIDRQTDRQTGR
jgi:hypothetical protein